MTEAEEKAYLRGRRVACIEMAQHCVRQLGIDDPSTKLVVALDELERVRMKLREVCDVVGSNDWPDSADLGDVIEKYVLPYVEDA